MNRLSISLKRIFLIATIALIILEAVVFAFLSNYSGTLDFINDNTANYIKSAVSARSTAFSERMTNQWSEMSNEYTNIISEIEKASEEIPAEQTPGGLSPSGFSVLKENPNEVEQVLVSSVPVLEGLINKNGVSGAFIILNTSDDAGSSSGNNYSSRSCVYIRKETAGGYSLVSGPSSIASAKDISKSSIWKKEMAFGDEYDRSFYLMPALYEKKSSDYSPSDFTYWAKPFSLFDGDEEIITCSVPLVGKSGEFYGVIGVEVSASTINKIFPIGIISVEYADTYVVSVAVEGARNYFEDVIACGRISEETLASIAKSPTYTYDYDSKNTYYRITEETTGTDLCAFVSNLGVYNQDSYFSGTDDWYLMGIADESVLNTTYNTTVKMLMTALMISMLVSVLFVILFSSGFSSSVQKLMKSAEKLDGHDKVILDRIGIKEFDKLADKLETQNNTLVRYSSRTSKIIDLTNTPIATFEVSKNSNKVFVSKSIVNILSLNPALVINDYIDKKEWEEIYNNLTNPENMSYEGSAHINKGTDSEKWIKSNTYENDEVIIGVLSDITDNVKERLRIEYERDYDAATGIINRRMFFIKAEELLPKNKSAFIVLWDIDNIKHINDVYGHSTGDKLLKAAAVMLDSFSDPEHIITARLSGDEFVTLISCEDDSAEYEKKLTQMYSLLTNVSVSAPDEAEIFIEASAGTASYPTDADNVKSLLRCADYAIFRDKSAENKRNNGIAKYK